MYLLEVQRDDGRPAEAGAVARQEQAAGAEQQAAQHRGIDGMQTLDREQLRRPFGHRRQQADRDEGLERELAPHAAPGEPVERQVDDEEQLAQTDARGVVQQERGACRAAGHEPDLGEQDQRERNEQRAGEDGLGVFERRMPVNGLAGGGDVHCAVRCMNCAGRC